MENNAKISLTINVAGSTRHCLGVKKIPYKVTKQDLTSVNLPPYMGNKVVFKGVAKVPDYVYKDAQIHINISRIAYDWMISDDKPAQYFRKDWKKLSPKQRLAWHMQFISESRNGKSYSHHIIED